MRFYVRDILQNFQILVLFSSSIFYLSYKVMQMILDVVPDVYIVVLATYTLLHMLVVWNMVPVVTDVKYAYYHTRTWSIHHLWELP